MRSPVLLEDMFHATLLEFLGMWGLTEAEVRHECASGRLAVRGHKQLRFYYGDMRVWIARKRNMPLAVRAKVEAAGGLDKLERFRADQIRRCEINWVESKIKLPDGSILSDCTWQWAPKH